MFLNQFQFQRSDVFCLTCASVAEQNQRAFKADVSPEKNQIKSARLYLLCNTESLCFLKCHIADAYCSGFLYMFANKLSQLSKALNRVVLASDNPMYTEKKEFRFL